MKLTDKRPLLVRLLRRGDGGGAPAVIRAGLHPLSVLYERIVQRRRRLYQEGKRPVFDLGVPVVSVGNLTAGGTGKTPTVEWIARWCAANGRKPAILSRGYGTARGQGRRNDEARQLEQSLPGVPHYPNPDRVTAGKRAVAEGADCLILDDGFQHLRVKRTLNLVLIDALDPFGGGKVLPAGTLREPLSALCDADAAIITRADILGKVALPNLRQRVRSLLPSKPIFEAFHRPTKLTRKDGSTAEKLDWLAGKRVYAFCGIGNPEGFVRTLEKLGAEVVAARFRPDHARYRAGELAVLAQECLQARADCAVTTQKDAVKMTEPWPGTIPLRVLHVEIEFLSPQEPFQKLLKDWLSR